MTLGLAAVLHVAGSTTVGVTVPISSEDEQPNQPGSDPAPEIAWPTLGTVPDVLGSPWLCEADPDPVTPEPWVEPLPNEEVAADA